MKLTNGQGVMADDVPYEKYLSVAKERQIMSFQIDIIISFK